MINFLSACMCVKYYYYIQQFESYKVYSDKKVPTSKI